MHCEVDQRGLPLGNAVVALVFFTAATTLQAETLSFPYYQIELPAGWEHSIESGPGNGQGKVLSLNHIDGAGSLKLLSYRTPVVVDDDKLRNMTNVDASVPLSWQQWGDYSGYQYDYVENGSFYRQWWLVNERTMIFVTYQSVRESNARDKDEIDGIVRSVTAKNP